MTKFLRLVQREPKASGLLKATSRREFRLFVLIRDCFTGTQLSRSQTWRLLNHTHRRKA